MRDCFAILLVVVHNYVIASPSRIVLLVLSYSFDLPSPLCAQVGYRGAASNPTMQRFNHRMSSVRICVEWGFGRVGSLFRYCVSRDGLCIRTMPCDQIFFAAQLLTNCHACLYGNVVSSYFNVMPVKLEDYLNVQPGFNVPVPPPI